MLAESEGLLGELDGPLKPQSLWLEEFEHARELAKNAGMKRPLKLYKQWLTSDNVRKQRAEYVEVALEYLPNEAVVALQQAVMAKWQAETLRLNALRPATPVSVSIEMSANIISFAGWACRMR